jgi:hypothetical protein
MKLSAALLTLMIAGWSGIAAAKPCKDFDIKVQNNFTHDGIGQPIKVVDFDYWDDDKGKWREENWVGNLVIDFTRGATIASRNLEYVGDQSGVIIRVQFKYMTAKNGWSETLNAQSSSFICKDGLFKTVFVEPF